MRRTLGSDDMKGVALSALALTLAGCVSPESAPQMAQVAQARPDTCAKSEFATLLGTPINNAELPLTQTYRVIFPDSVVTTDFMADRMEVIVDANGIVTGLRCG